MITSENIERAAQRLGINRAVQQAGQFISRHPRSVTATIVVCLAGFGATAFGIAPMAPDASLLPKRTIVETVPLENVDAQLEALADYDIDLYRSDLTRSSDTADSLLRRLNVDDAEAAQFLRSDPTARKLLDGRAGKMLQVRTDDRGRLQDLVARFPTDRSELANTHFTRLVISREASGFDARLAIGQLTVEVQQGSGVIHTSLFAATDEARLPDSISTQLVEMFSTDIDFRRELRRGDTFKVLYESLTADGEPITWNDGAGRLLAAEFVNAGESHSAIWFKESGVKGAYYDLDGKSKQRSFLAAPLAFSRVTSGFAMRFHPILQNWRQHKGVDYGAPTGTPVRTVGDGIVEFAGWQNGYGNVIEITHSNNRSTTYAHLSRINVHKGQRVEQGQIVGLVGSTGWATGPHLHFEVKINGQEQDPLTIAKQSEAATISPWGKQQFAQLAKSMRAMLDSAQSMASAGGRTSE
ncbi:MAG: peptidase [Rhizobacter sp.]|nr:peptidase [Rhizobacter sp.]